MIFLVEDMQVVMKLRSRFSNRVFISQPYSRMCIIMSGLANIVKGLEIGQGGMKYPLTTFLKLRSSMFGVWISWDLSYPPEETNISWSSWIMCPNGWKHLLAPPMTPEWSLGFSKRPSSLVLGSPLSLLVTMVPTSLRRNLKPCWKGLVCTQTWAWLPPSNELPSGDLQLENQGNFGENSCKIEKGLGG